MSSSSIPPVQLSFASALAGGQSITAPIAVKGRLSYELDKQIYPLSNATNHSTPVIIYSLAMKQNNTVFVPITHTP